MIDLNTFDKNSPYSKTVSNLALTMVGFDKYMEMTTKRWLYIIADDMKMKFSAVAAGGKSQKVLQLEKG